MNRGSNRGALFWFRPSQRFNEAPIHESGKCMLEGPAFLSDSASMRPRFMNRGSGDGAVAMDPLQVASMRPRFMNRGSVCLASNRSGAVLSLQ